ncbi:MAG: VanW family protein [Actinomycetota bacterium]|nr:VanW family protein [Actinomycetota bacterium]
MPRHDDRRTARWVVWAAVVGATLVVVHLAAAGAVAVLRRATPGVLTGVTVAGQPVGGLPREQLRTVVADLAAERLDATITVTSDGRTIRVRRGTAGLDIDVASTTEAAWRRGRRGLWRALVDHVASRMGRSLDVQLRHDVDEQVLRRWSAQAADHLSRQPRAARVAFEVGEDPATAGVRVREPTEGVQVAASDVAAAVEPILAEAGEVTVQVEHRTLRPSVTSEDVQAALPPARRAISGPVHLTNPGGGADLELAPGEIAAILEVRTHEDAPPGQRLQIAAGGDRLREVIGSDRLEKIEVEPVEARFEVVGDEVRIRGGTVGFALDAETTADALVEIATRTGDRTGELRGRTVEPDRTREEAEELGIRERVSRFTTRHDCCEPRVTNIHRMADIVDGAIIEPGASFSLNGHVGRRTRARGFVGAPVIVEGEFEEEVGGGVSQFATTFFNAAYFSGIELDEFQPHSYYISRYPMGRESTIYYGLIDVAVTNDSPYGILVHTAYTGTSITVEFFSTPWADVDSQTIGPYNVVEGAARDGFDVTVRRTITYPDGSQRTEEFFHRYQPED